MSAQWPEGWGRPGETRPGGGKPRPYEGPRSEQEEAPRTRVLPPHLDPRQPPRRNLPPGTYPPPQPAPRGSSALPRPPRVRRWLRPRRLAALVLLLVVAVLANFVALAIYVSTHLRHVNALHDYAGRPADGTNSVWLLVGSDSRSGLTAKQRRALHTGSTGGQRTDTMLLLSVPRTGAPTLVSLPRDSYVSIPGHGKNKLNAAYAIGGAALLTRTVETVTGVHVDHVAEIGFNGIVGMTDAVGGVRQCVPRRMDDPKAGLHVKKGCQVMNGKTALAYVRARYSDPLGDLGRVQRQRSFLHGLIARVASPAVLLRPDRQWQLAQAATSSVAFDGASPFELVRLVRAMRAVGGPGGHQLTVPVADTNYQTPVGDAVTWDGARAAALFHTLAR